MIDPKKMPLGAIVLVKCYRASSSQSNWCQRTHKGHIDLLLRGVVSYNEEHDGKEIQYVFEDWNAAKEPKGREQFRQQICPHWPKLKDVVRVVSKTGGEKLRCGDDSWIRHVDGTTTKAPENEA